MAQETVNRTGPLSVPLHLRNAPTSLMKELGYGEEYRYAHHYQNNFVREHYLPEELDDQQFYFPGSNPREEEIRKRLDHLWNDMKSYGKKK
jgi:putative ATPase